MRELGGRRGARRNALAADGRGTAGSSLSDGALSAAYQRGKEELERRLMGG